VIIDKGKVGRAEWGADNLGEVFSLGVDGWPSGERPDGNGQGTRSTPGGGYDSCFAQHFMMGN